MRYYIKKEEMFIANLDCELSFSGSPVTGQQLLAECVFKSFLSSLCTETMCVCLHLEPT